MSLKIVKDIISINDSNSRFSNAAVAFENCDKKFKAVFAEPKANRSQDSTSSDRSSSYRSDDTPFSTQLNSLRNTSSNKRSPSRDFALFMHHSTSSNKQSSDKSTSDVEYQLSIICSDSVSRIFVVNVDVYFSSITDSYRLIRTSCGDSST